MKGVKSFGGFSQKNGRAGPTILKLIKENSGVLKKNTLKTKILAAALHCEM